MKRACVLALTVFAVSLNLCRSQSIHVGSCPAPKAKEDFDFKKFSGRWYDVERTFSLFEEGLRCVSNEFVKDTTGAIKFTRKGLTVANQTMVLQRGKIIDNPFHNVASFNLVLPGLTMPLRYRVLDTDYENFAVVWTCFEVPGLGGRLGHTESVKVVSRHLSLPNNLQKKAAGVVTENGLDNFLVRKIPNRRCPALKNDHLIGPPFESGGNPNSTEVREISFAKEEPEDAPISLTSDLITDQEQPMETTTQKI